MYMALQLHATTMAALGLVAACVCSLAAAQTVSPAQGIYTCIDAKGRKITADRPIAECMDRTQREISRSGLVKREIAPPPTADERAALEEKEKTASELKAREVEEKKRDRALLARYPNRAVHDKERAEALSQVDEVIKASGKRSQELSDQRKAINADFEFYKKDPGKTPVSLRRRLEENEASVAAQKRFVAEQDAERQRVNLRFDEELVKLRKLWDLTNVVPAKAPPAAAKK